MVKQNVTLFKLYCLSAVGELDKPSGTDIQDYLTDYYGDVNHGRLYPNLDSLVEQGFLIKGTHDERTNKYTITAQGVDKLREVSELLSPD